MSVYWWVAIPFFLVGAVIFTVAFITRERYLYVVKKLDGTTSPPMSLRAARRYARRYNNGRGVYFLPQWRWADEDDNEENKGRNP